MEQTTVPSTGIVSYVYLEGVNGTFGMATQPFVIKQVLPKVKGTGFMQTN